MSYLGTVMYFSKDGSHAFVWPDADGQGPALLRKVDFPLLWDRIEVGSILRYALRRGDMKGLVALVCQIGTERLDPPASAPDQAAPGSADCWRDQSSA